MKENSTGKKPFSRSRLVKELSWSCELPQTKVSAILDTLAALARREARSTFILPGICKLEVVRRKPRKMRNPRTGESFMLPERDALRITAPRSLKLACAKVIAPAPALAAPSAPAAEEKTPAVVAPAAEPAAKTEAPVTPPPVAAPAWSTAPASAEPVAEAEKPAETPADQEKPAEPTAEEPVAENEEPAEPAPAPEEPSAPPPPVDPDALISFRCPRCHQEVEATGDMVGMETECPTCGNPITVPAESEPDTIHAGGGSNDGTDGPVRHAQTVSTREAESLSPEKLKGLTIRINVSDLGLDNPPEPPPAEPSAEQMITFVCDACKQEIEASRDLIGEAMLCPGCGAPITVPAESTPAEGAAQEGSQESDPKVLQAMKARTMRIDIGDDF